MRSPTVVPRVTFSIRTKRVGSLIGAGGYFAGRLGWVLIVAGLAIVIRGAVLFIAKRETSPTQVGIVLRKAQR